MQLIEIIGGIMKKGTLTVLLFILVIPITAWSEEFAHCNALLQHGITDITRHKSAKHTLSYKWHSNCGLDFSSAIDSSIKHATGSVFGFGSTTAGANSNHQRVKLKEWCVNNKDFAVDNKDLYEEARTISDGALQAWNQCQDIAKKDVFIKATPSGPHSDFVHFEIDSTLNADLRLFPEKTVNYTCDVQMVSKEGVDKGIPKQTDLSTHPYIKNSNIHYNCQRMKPSVENINGLKKLTYEQAYISIQTSGPALQFYAPEAVKDYVTTPPGSVVAFNLSACPNGWSEYEEAYGRFIRGFDRSGKIDPDGKRKLGIPQEDSFEKHIHKAHMQVGAEPPRGAGGALSSRAAGGHGKAAKDSQRYETNGLLESTGDTEETRPKNIALLYCIKK